MDETQLRNVVSKYLLPMFPGSRLLYETLPTSRKVDLASFSDPCTIAISLSFTPSSRLLVNRSQAFSHSDVVFASWFMAAVSEISELHSRDFFEALVENAVPSAISGYLTSQFQRARPAAFRIIRQLESWAAQTYEGQPITCAIGIDSHEENDQTPTLDQIWDHDFSAVLTSGLDTVLVATQDLNVLSFDALPPPKFTGLAPYRLMQLAEWTEQGRILFSLNRNGELLIFNQGNLSFAKRRGRWFHFPHESMARRLGRIGTTTLRESVYETCLDVSFARTGGCIAIISSSAASRLGQIIHDDDLLSAPAIKSRCLQQIMQRPFPEMDRRLRQELVAIDGATILDHTGNLLSAGAIVEVPPGSHAGARRAAAIALARYGLAVKISHDGGILGFARDQDGMPPQVTCELG
ncbi:hypothetical protein [Aeoliella sp.]|uniref:hypothetical protein n=1 Tax=Aeoliella sp. TaxID=2795800 RepID=UPI003CCB9173